MLYGFADVYQIDPVKSISQLDQSNRSVRSISQIDQSNRSVKSIGQIDRSNQCNSELRSISKSIKPIYSSSIHPLFVLYSSSIHPLFILYSSSISSSICSHIAPMYPLFATVSWSHIGCIVSSLIRPSIRSNIATISALFILCSTFSPLFHPPLVGK